MSEQMLPTPTPEQAIEDLRDDGFWPQAMAMERLLRESRYHQQEIETLLSAKRKSEDQGSAYRKQRDKLREALETCLPPLDHYGARRAAWHAREALKATENT